MDFEKYRKLDMSKLDAIELESMITDIFQQLEDDEDLIDIVARKDIDWLPRRRVYAKAEEFDFEKFILNSMNSCGFMNPLECKDIFIRGDVISDDGYIFFWKRENEERKEEKNGKNYVRYSAVLKINGQNVEREDLCNIFPNFKYSKFY